MDLSQYLKNDFQDIDHRERQVENIGLNTVVSSKTVGGQSYLSIVTAVVTTNSTMTRARFSSLPSNCHKHYLSKRRPRFAQGYSPLREQRSTNIGHRDTGIQIQIFQIGAGLYAVGRPVQKRNDEDGQIGTIQSLPLERGALFNRFFGEPAHGPPHVAGGASGPIGGCQDESRTDNPDLDLRHVFDRNNRKTDLI